MASSSILFLSLFLLLPILGMANNVTLSSSLSAGENTAWVSSSGEFAFGFTQLPNNTNLFLLAIWYEKIPDKTVIWHANRDSPAAQRGSTVVLTADGLVLTDPQGHTIWTQDGITDATYAAMLDTGNFVLAGNDSVYIWESFKNPTDTILPTQTLGTGGMLLSRLSETNYSKGRFELHFSNGVLTLNPIAWPTEFPYGLYHNTSYGNSPDSFIQLVFNSTTPVATNYYRATLDFNGVFTLYSHPRSSSLEQSWSIEGYIPENICFTIFNEFGSGACGYNSYCSMLGERPSCKCPPGYLLVDQSNEFGDCRPNFPPGCGVDDGSKNPEELYEFNEIQSVDWPLGDFERLEPYNQTECEISCFHDCSCAVAIFGGVTCWKKRLPLSNGRFDPNLSKKALIKVRKSVPPWSFSNGPISGKKKHKWILLGSFLLSISVIFNVLMLVKIFLHKGKPKRTIQDSYLPESNLNLFTYEELEEATDGFKEELGSGSCGTVYKGVLKFSSRKLVAVKKLNKLAQEGEKEFRTEVSAVGKTHHKNLVRLLGFCDEGPHRLLVYEFMSNGTLANFLFGLPRPDWNQRTCIAMGIARGLVYLHEECDAQIIHCDIKPQNILLDDYFTARISDFGLAKLLQFDQTRTHTGIRGTRGYVALEWFKNAPVTVKVDVYSFGVVLLEIICCRKCVVMEFGEDARAILVDWAYDCYIEGKLDALVENDEAAMGDIDKLQKWVMIALWCIQEAPSKRPTMKTVSQMLEGSIEVPVPPCPTSTDW